MQGRLKEHHFILPNLCIEIGAHLDILPADDSNFMGKPQIICRVSGTPIIIMLPVDKVEIL